MQKIYSFLFSKRTLYVIFGVFAVAYFANFFNRYIQADEPFFGEEAYWLLKEGVVRIKSLPLLLDFDQRVYVYYKLFVYAGAGIISIFGWSVWPLKIFIFTLFVIFLFVFDKWLKGNSINFSLHQRIIALFFLITTPIMIEQTFTFRPEIPMMFVVFFSFVFIRKGLQEECYKHIILGALLAGISFLIHLNGNAIVIAGFAYILSYKKYKYVIVYSAVSGLTCLLYLFDMASVESFNAFLYQLRNWPLDNYPYVDNGALGFIVAKLKGVLSEHERFFWSGRVSVTSAIFFICLIFGFKEFKRKYPEILRYFLILVLSMSLFGGLVVERYLIYYLPFMVMIMSFTITYYIENRSRIVPYIVTILFVAHILAIINLFKMDFSWNYNHDKMHANILNQIPENSRVLAPWEFIYNGIEKYQILSYKNIEYYNLKKVEKEVALQIINKLDVNYIIVCGQFADIINVNLTEVVHNGFYLFKPVYTDGKFTILKKELLLLE